MASLSMTGAGSPDAIAELLAHEIQSSGLSCQLVDSIYRSAGPTGIYVMVFEKYYWRANNRASLTVVVSGEGDTVYVDAIGSGGGQGPIFKFSWGAEEDFVGTVGEILSRYGFW
ncbi:MAG: DUF6054 family protein [Christensenellales bacterium]